jgi:hypothetical protein
MMMLPFNCSYRNKNDKRAENLNFLLGNQSLAFWRRSEVSDSKSHSHSHTCEPGNSVE